MNVNNNFEKKGINDAPVSYTSEKSVAWANGYNEALERTKAKVLLDVCEKLLAAYNDTGLKLSSEEIDSLEDAIEKANPQSIQLLNLRTK